MAALCHERKAHWVVHDVVLIADRAVFALEPCDQGPMAAGGAGAHWWLTSGQIAFVVPAH